MGTCLIVPVSILLALLTSASNAIAAVLQRRAAAEARSSRSLRLSLIAELARRKVWLAGIAMVVVAALCQAGALATGPVALVQPIFIIELPITLLLGSYVMHRKVPPRIWIAVVAVTAALGSGLAAAQPGGGSARAVTGTWAIALIATGAFEFVVIGAALRLTGERRAALLGLAAACGYALTATLMKTAMASLSRGAAAFFTTWELYATAAAGVGALFLLQNALQAGTLVASQPMLTVGDALISISYGVVLYGEQVRVGWWLVPEIIALIVIVLGCVEIARSPLSAAHPGQPETAAVPSEAHPDPGPGQPQTS
jgi:drug/metabolite transporter (DMT)-like permease